MNLSDIPNEIWNAILSNVTLKDALNFYLVFPSTIDSRIYNYLGLKDNDIIKNGIVYEYFMCEKCQNNFNKSIASLLATTVTIWN